MSSIGVVVFRNSTLGKPQVLQESVNNSVNITNNDANQSVRREIIIVRKKQKIQYPLNTVSVTSLVRDTQAKKSDVLVKRPRLQENIEEVQRSPTPLAVARRNARERNRVRQVNDGFAALRSHIPEEVAAAFENANSNRGPNKKLSKVETLRMAVEYIRNLESLLNIGHADKENLSHPSMESFPSPASSSPRENSQERSYFSLNSPTADEEEVDEDELDGSLNQVSTHNYVDYPTSETFQLMAAPHLYEEEDGIQPLTPSSDLLCQDELNSHILDGQFPFPNSAEQFTIIPEQAYCNETDVAINDGDFEVKYAESLHHQLHSTFENGTVLPLSAISPDLILPHDQYKLKQENSALTENPYDDLELKKELPDIQVTPEDREQFEETLKWWQEKTKQSRPFAKKNN